MHAPARGNRPITERPSEPDLGELDAQRQAARQALEDTRQEQRAVAARENLARRSRGFTLEDAEAYEAEKEPLRRRVEELQEQSGEETPGLLPWLGKNAAAGLSQFNQGLASTLDFFLPTELFFGEEKDPVSRLNRYYTGERDIWGGQAAEVNEQKGGAYSMAGQLVQGTTGATPNALLALMSGGGSIAAEGTAALGQAASGLGSTIASAASALAKNPVFWTSVLQTTGPAYDSAKADGAGDLEATASALITGLLNSAVEIGGGPETLPAGIAKGGESAVRQWVKSMLEEGREEVVQGAIENLAAKAVYDQARPWASLEEENAVLNPVRAAREFAGGAAVGGVLGGAQMGTVGLANRLLFPAGDAWAGAEARADVGIGPYDGREAGAVVKGAERDNAEVWSTPEQAETGADSRRVSNRQAEQILADPEALAGLRAEAGLELSDGMTRAQQRAAVKSAVERLTGRTDRVQTGEDAGGHEGRPYAEARRYFRRSSEQLPVAESAERDRRRGAAAEARTGTEARVDVGGETESTAARLREAGSAFGRNGARALTAAYDGEMALDRYYGGFAAYYQAGLSGRGMDGAKGPYTGALNEAQRFAAWSAGRNDGLASLAREKRAAQFAPSAGNGSGLVFDGYVSDTLDGATANRVNQVAKALGVRVRFADSVRGGTANAQLRGADILVEKGNPNPVLFLLGHEWTHRLQELAPEEYRRFRNFASEGLQGEAQVLLEGYRQAGEDIGYEAALDEAAANYAGKLLEDGKLLDSFIEKHRDDRTLLEKVRDAIRAVVRRLTGAEKRQAQTAEEKLTAALEAGARQTRRLQNRQSGGTMDSTRYSLKEEQNYGRAREESREDFKRRCLEEGYSVYEGREISCGFRPFQGEHAQGRSARQVQEEVKRLGIDADIVDGPVLWNRNGVTRIRNILEAATVEHSHIFISSTSTISPRNAAGHEAFHFWTSLPERTAYIEAIEDNLIFSGKPFQDYQSRISDAYLGETADLSDQQQTGGLVEEIFAYISGDIHEGTNDDTLRPMFRDYDAVKAAWEALVRENAGDARASLKGSEDAAELAELRRENERLKERVEEWKGQTRRTAPGTADRKAVDRAARELIRAYGSELEASDLSGGLKRLYDYMGTGRDGRDELTWTEARRRAEELAGMLVDSAVETDDSLYRQYGELRDYLRGAKLTISEQDAAGLRDYDTLRRHNFGRMSLGKGGTNIDQVYEELAERWPEFFDAQRETHPADQLEHISDVLDDIYRMEERNPFAQYRDQAVSGAAGEILETFFDLPQVKTFADRQAAKLEKAKAKGRQQVQQAREQRDARLAELREQNRARVQRAIERERETRTRQVGALKERYQARDAAGRERRAARELRAKITRHASALSQKLLRPSDQHHIPEAMRGSVAAMLESINQESQYTLDENGKRVKDGRGTPTKRTEAFRALKEQYAKIVAEGGDMVIDPSLLGSDADGIKGGFDAVIAMKDTKLADMSVAQLQTVWQVVKAVEHSVNTAGKVLSKAKYARTADWAQAISIGTSSRRAKNSLTRNHALIDLETPYTFFSHYGEAGKAVYRMLRDAQDQQQLMVDHVAEEVRKIVDPKTVKKLEATTHTFTTERGEKLTLSTAQVMELYELVKRKQAHDHLLKGGVVQPEIKTSQIRRGTDSIRLTEGDLVNITGTLTPEQVKIADGLQGLTRGVLADYGNKASMEAYGYKKFTESDYWPIKSAKEGLHSNIEKGGNNTRSIKNIGMAKTTMPHVSNALDLAGIFTTFANHASDMTDYASWLCTMEDINRLFNYQFRDEEGNPTGKTIKGLLDRVGGPGSQKYWHNLMEDIQNGINAPGDSPMWDIAGKTIGGFKGAAVGANIRVVIQQPTAFFRAAAVLDPQDMARGLARGVTRGSGWKKALQYSPIAMRKDAGGFDISSPYKMTETLFDNRTNVRKLNDALSAPAGAADAVTWGKLWNACEWATAREHQGLAKGSEAFYRQTAKLFSEVIDQTQVVDGVLQRSNIMRSSNAVVKQATSFMGEPIMSLNLLMRAYDQVRYEQNSQKRGKAIKTMGRAATALVVTNVVNALAQSLIDAMRDDDEDKKYWERFRAAFTGISGDEETPWEKAWNAIMEGNVGSNMNPLGQIPFVKDALSIMQGYDVSRTEMEIVSDLIQAGQTAIQSADGQGKRTRAYALKGLLAACAKMFGIPASNLTRDMWGLARSAAVETGNIPLQYEMEKAIYNISNTGNKNRYYAILYRALEQGDMGTYQHIRDDLMNSMGVDGASIDSAMRSRYNKAVEKDPDYTLPQRARDLIGSRDKYAPAKEKEETFGADDLGSSAYRAYSDQRANDYRSMADDLTSSPIFQGMDDETRDKVLKAAYDLADKSALADHSDGQYEVSTKWMAQADDAEAQGIEPWEYVLFHTAYNEMEGTKDADGKTVKGEAKSDHVREWLEDFSGLTDEQRAFLWGTVYTSEW